MVVSVETLILIDAMPVCPRLSVKVIVAGYTPVAPANTTPVTLLVVAVAGVPFEKAQA
jgi:hypothetical protein